MKIMAALTFIELRYGNVNQLEMWDIKCLYLLWTFWFSGQFCKK